MDADFFLRDHKMIDKAIEEGLDKLTDKDLRRLSDLSDQEIDDFFDEELKTTVGYESIKVEPIYDEPGTLNLKELSGLITEAFDKSEDGVKGKIDDKMLRDLVVALALELDDEQSFNTSDEDFNGLDDEESISVSDEDLDEIHDEEPIRPSGEEFDGFNDEESNSCNGRHSDVFNDEELNRYVKKAYRLHDDKKLEQLDDDQFEELLYGVSDDENDFDGFSDERVAGLRFLNFNAGLEKRSQSEPCEEEFIRALLRDLAWLTFLVNDVLLKQDQLKQDRPLPRDAGIAAQNFCEAMKQCSRLKACPELFPSPALRSEFLQNLGELLPSISMLAEYLDMFSYHNNILQDPPPEDGSNEHKIPHPNLPDGKNPWNKWLDNSAEYNPGRISIQQRIPRVGHFIMKKITLEYDAIEADFAKNNFIVRHPDEESLDLHPPGQEYNHLSKANFTTIQNYDPGYTSREVPLVDEDDLFTLECLSIWGLPEGESEELETAHVESNFPYFQLALSGEKEENTEDTITFAVND